MKGTPEFSTRRNAPDSMFLASRFHKTWVLGITTLLLICPRPAWGSLQFDIFLGYDNIVREAGWFPIVCEVFNDGPSFNAVIEISTGAMRSDQIRRVPVELPTNTRKRIVIPMFASGGRFFDWNARLTDDRGKVQAERPGLRPKTLAWEGILLGALPKTFAGMPVFAETRMNRPELKPQVARLQPEVFPDNPIALESLTSLYLNSEKALDLKVNQWSALVAWIHEGGHLIVSVDQISDIKANAWLEPLLPLNVGDLTNLTLNEEIQDWLRKEEADVASSRRTVAPGRRFNPSINSNPTLYNSLLPDPNFGRVQLPIVTGALRDGKVILAAQATPLIIEAHRGRGRVTLLTFNPEREPFRSWKHRPWFWSKLLQVPSEWYSGGDFPGYGGSSIDGVFGALIDSRQVKKLPVKWLLLLLVGYLVVIGPFDQYWLKRIGRQMLTWVTFPCYVVLFSLLIYFIGYKLRAGVTEWNELHVVDILPRGGTRADLRGRSYASLYSSANERYKLAFTPTSSDVMDRSYATLRSEVIDMYGSGREGGRATVEQYGNSFRADVFVPVWTSLLYVNDWMQPGTAPLVAAVSVQDAKWDVTVENRVDHALTEARAVIRGTVYELGVLPAGSKKTFQFEAGRGLPLQSFVQQHGGNYHQVVERRKNALGDESAGWLGNPSLNSMVASFSAQLSNPNAQRGWVAPAGLDLTKLVDRGDAVILAWDPDHTFSNPITQFKPPINRRNTLLRLAVPVQSASPAAARLEN